MANALPLLLGAGAIFMLMGKKGAPKGSPSVIVVEKGDTKAEVDGHFDPAIHNRLCAILALVDGFSASQVVSVVGEAAVKYPKTLFLVFADKEAIEQLAAWMGISFGGDFPVGAVVAVAGKDPDDSSGTPAGKMGVTSGNAKAEILQAIDAAMAAGSNAGPRGLASVGPGAANATGPTTMSLAGAGPSPRQTSGNVFSALVSAVPQRRVRR